MQILQLTSILSLPVWLRLACVDAALGDEEDHSYDSDVADQQEPLFGLCPDYTSYARHIQ